jgi:hypothetical protein
MQSITLTFLQGGRFSFARELKGVFYVRNKISQHGASGFLSGKYDEMQGQ